MLENILTDLYQALISLVREIFNTLFGEWNWQVLFNWLPSDFLTVASWFIIFLFGLMLFKVIKTLLPL